MRLRSAEARARGLSERLFLGNRGDVEAYCVIEWRAHRTLSSFQRDNPNGGGNYTVSRAPKRYELLRGGAVFARPESYEAAMAALEGT